MIAFQPAPAAVPEGIRVYAVGDVHGCLHRLRRLHHRIAADLTERPAGSAVLVHLGDYVDRGPESAGVLRYLMAGEGPAGVTETVNLRGNHEAMMLDACTEQDAAKADLWLMNGGTETLASFGLDQHSGPANWAAALAPEPLHFVGRLPLMHRIGGYAFVHAGVRPGFELTKQVPGDLLWIREPFLSSKRDFGAVIVHGHTPTLAPEIRPNRIGIDTGAVLGGVLTCAVLEFDRVGFFTG